MKHLPTLLICALITLSACDTSQKHADTSVNIQLSKEDESKLRYLKELEWPKAYAEHDTLLLDRILGDDFQMIDMVGDWYAKADEIDWIRKNATQNDSFRYEIKRLEMLENGTVLICGTGHILKDSVRSIYQSSNVLVKRNDIWKAVLSHVSGYKIQE